MAEVTVGTSPPPSRHVAGDMVERFYTISGASGSTLTTGMRNLIWADAARFCLAGTASLITGIVFNSTTGVITFTSSGTMVNELVQVIALAG